MAAIAQDVTHDGPIAWRKHFADSPAFFMVNDGQMAFPRSTDVPKGIEAFAATIRSIRLEWGSDLRVDPLTPNFAVVAVSFLEDQEQLDGKHVVERGYFTGVVELHEGALATARCSLVVSASAIGRSKRGHAASGLSPTLRTKIKTSRGWGTRQRDWFPP
jgi:hypothetical protein